MPVLKATVEAEIVSGYIRKIIEIRLGYVRYNEPGAYRKNMNR